MLHWRRELPSSSSVRSDSQCSDTKQTIKSSRLTRDPAIWGGGGSTLTMTASAARIGPAPGKRDRESLLNTPTQTLSVPHILTWIPQNWFGDLPTPGSSYILVGTIDYQPAYSMFSRGISISRWYEGLEKSHSRRVQPYHFERWKLLQSRTLWTLSQIDTYRTVNGTDTTTLNSSGWISCSRTNITANREKNHELHRPLQRWLWKRRERESRPSMNHHLSQGDQRRSWNRHSWRGRILQTRNSCR